MGAALGGLLGLIAGLVPIVDAGPIASALVGAVIGALLGGLMRLLAGEGAAREGTGAAGTTGDATLVTVQADTDQVADCAAKVLRTHGAVDIEQRPVQGHHDGQVLPVAEEELAVGKREVGRGGVRVQTRVASVPAEQTVQLREEHATIERHAVDRPAAPGEALFTEQTFEVLEMSEEPVVQKLIRVKEEVRIAKHATQRTETIRETVRKTEVGIERSYPGPERRVQNGSYGGRERRVQLRAL